MSPPPNESIDDKALVHDDRIHVYLAHERRERRRRTVTHEDDAHAEALELGKSHQQSVHLTGTVRSAEVAEEHDKGRATQQVAEAPWAARPLDLGETQFSRHRPSDLHAGTIAPLRTSAAPRRA
jgi:hypothetical protein